MNKPLSGKLLIWNSASKNWSPMWQWVVMVEKTIIKQDKRYLSEINAKKAGRRWAKLLNVEIKEERRWET